MKIATYAFAAACLVACLVFAAMENIPMTIFWGVMSLWNKSNFDHLDKEK